MNYLKYFTFFIFLLSSLPALCQTGPGGVGNSTNNTLWLKANEGVYNDGGSTLASRGDSVQQWNDQSGNNIHAIQNTNSLKPHYISGVINNRPVIRFSASEEERLLSDGVSTSNAASVWAVTQYSSLPTNNPGVLHGAPDGSAFDEYGQNKSIGMWASKSTSELWGRAIEADNNTVDFPQQPVLSSNTPYIFNNVHDGSNTMNQYVNNGGAGSVSYDGTLKDWSDFGIGRQGSESWEGDIAEVIVYNLNINSAQRIIINNYLAAKYNITLSSNDYYDEDDNGDFDHEMAGIGQSSGGDNHTDAQGSGMIRILNPMGLENDEFYLWGHNNKTAKAINTTDVPDTVEARLEREWRGSERGDITGFDVRFDLTNLTPVTASDLRLLVDIDNDGTFADETAAGGGVINGATDLGGNIYEFTGVSAMNNNLRFTIGTTNTSQTPLPVNFLNFNVELIQNQILVSWATSSETNNDYFIIEHTENGKDWKRLKKIEAEGNSKSVTQYKSWLPKPASKISYYKIKQVDINQSSISHSQVQTLKLNPISQTNLSIYPNPATQHVYLKMKNIQEAKTYITNSLGRKVNINKTMTNKKARLNVSQLTKGVYFINIQFSNRVITKKLIIK